MFRKNPVRTHLIVILILCAVGTLASWNFFAARQNDLKYWIASWLLAVNVVTFGYYGFDKALSKNVVAFWWRVPETVLHALAILGGSPAALAAMWIFRHKTIKRSFRILFWSIVILQTALTAYIVKKLWWD